MPNQGDLRVWWIPQIPGEPFFVQVTDVFEGSRLLNTLADYDAFQYEHNIKPDYSNIGGLQEYRPDIITDDEDKWTDWQDDATGDTLDEWLENEGMDL